MKTIVSAFDGMSCGQIAIDFFTKDYKYFASEVEVAPIKVTQHNFPNTNQLGDIRNISYRDGVLYSDNGEFEVGDVYLFMGGSPCFPKGQRIITNKGFKNIEDIKKGDVVLTHKGRYREVVTPMERVYNGKLYKIRPTYYNFNIETTNEHPFFTQRGWVNAENLKEDDYLSMPLNKETIDPQQITYKQAINQNKEVYKTTDLPILNENFWKLVGYWLAEGWTRDKRNGENSRNTYRIFLSVTERKMKFIQPVIEALGIHYRIEKSRTCDKINFGSKDYWLYIKQFTKGTKSVDKLIPEFVQNMPKHLISAFVEGYKNGDGSENNESIGYTSTSKILLEGLQRLLLKTENKLYSLTQSHYVRESMIEGRVVNAKDSYSLHKNKTDNKFAYFTDDYVFYKVRTITTEDVNSLHVYNFEVEEDNSYCLPITAVHNCQNFSFAGTTKGMVTKDNLEITDLEQYLELKKEGFEFEGQSYLFWEYVRLLKEIDPKYFLLENVKMSKKWQDVIDNTLRCKPILINSSLVSAQNRERLYWTNIPINGIPNDKGLFLNGIIKKGTGKKLSEQTAQRPRTLRNYRAGDQKSFCMLATMWKGSQSNGMTVIDDNGLRNITPLECERLQTVPDNYTNVVANTNRYRMLGNGWTVDIIKHILKNIF